MGLWLWEQNGAAGVFGALGAVIFFSFLLMRGFRFRTITPEQKTPLRQEKLRDIVYEKQALPPRRWRASSPWEAEPSRPIFRSF